MAATEINAIFDDGIKLRPISYSQEEILRHCSFSDPDDGAPVCSGEIPVTSTGIAMVSLPETAQDPAKDRASQDVFHTPPEQQSSQSASEGHGRAVHKAAETDDETQGFFDFSENAEAAEYVDLRDDSPLGFAEGMLNQGTERTLVAECLDGNDGARIIEISRSEVDKFRILKRKLPSSKEGNYEAEEGTDEGDKIVNVIAETVERKKGGEEQPESSAFSSSAINLLKKVAEIKKEIRDDKNFVFDIFKALSKESYVDDDSLKNVSFLKLARHSGLKFPHPFWWKEEDGKERN
ncbi:hypothetical protein QN277_003772 [Acacia crassicarpa]|uniref:Uncharacterized protein n=1 Tax=Acacia crassicarpa TaxID=499986 RepID=A0AAE1JWK3_9FABA|nr:hypothetical protein QN277_003772 [Acacia crassicarpa]